LGNAKCDFIRNRITRGIPKGIVKDLTAITAGNIIIGAPIIQKFLVDESLVRLFRNNVLCPIIHDMLNVVLGNIIPENDKAITRRMIKIHSGFMEALIIY
tara:strand:- start:163 stop:462 length:300 start_codon:yes stop_codon:yes gene_type:complete